MSMPLAKDLQSKKLIVVGTLRANKKEEPPCMKKKDRPSTAVHCYNANAMLTSCPVKAKD